MIKTYFDPTFGLINEIVVKNRFFLVNNEKKVVIFEILTLNVKSVW